MLVNEGVVRERIVIGAGAGEVQEKEGASSGTGKEESEGNDVGVDIEAGNRGGRRGRAEVDAAGGDEAEQGSQT